HAAHHSADDAAHEGSARIAAAMLGRCALRLGWGTPGRLRTVIAGGRCRGDDLRQQGLVLELVEIARRRITTGRLPALEHGPGLVGERTGHLGVEAEPVEAALHVATLA